ncbi:hypothetical protein CRYUN_Cryun23aG0010900 [Craigia yunnanensis]
MLFCNLDVAHLSSHDNVNAVCSFRLLPVVFKFYKAIATLATGHIREVRSVYEGRGRKRSKEGEEESENSSKSARMSAKARTDSLRARKALSIISNNRTIVKRSMGMKRMEQQDEEMLFEVEVIVAKEEEKKDDNKPVELVQQQPVNEVVLENKGDDGGLLTLDDWPSTWTYEEEWSWFKVGYECGWYSYWETMNGDFWTPMRDDNKEPVWNDDLWNFKDNNEITKP